MRAQKLLLTIITAFLTLVFLVAGALFYFLRTNTGNSLIAIFLLGCTGAFSVYFHVKTAKLYPFTDFDEPLEELSKKYWALHVAFGLILFIVGVWVVIHSIINSKYYLSIQILFILLLIFGIWTLLDAYNLNKFIVSYKERRERQEGIDDIGNETF